LVDSRQGDHLPEVWKVVEGIPRVNDVGRSSLVLIAQEASSNDLNGGMRLGDLFVQLCSITSDISTATTRAQIDATAIANWPVPAPMSTTTH
jgi:hypothetical protein